MSADSCSCTTGALRICTILYACYMTSTRACRQLLRCTSSECARQLVCPKSINLNSCGTPPVTCLAVRTFVFQGGNVCADHCVQRAVHDVAVLCFGVRMKMGPIARCQTSCGIVWTSSVSATSDMSTPHTRLNSDAASTDPSTDPCPLGLQGA